MKKYFTCVNRIVYLACICKNKVLIDMTIMDNKNSVLTGMYMIYSIKNQHKK